MSKIVLDHISKKLGDNLILDDICLSLSSGQVIGFQGINGSGKTMLMRVIAGLVLPSSGKVLIDGKELHKEIRFPQSMGILLESPSFLDMYTGKKNLQLLSSLGPVIPEQEIDDLLREVGMFESKNRKYKKYSLGMKQRLGIAAAIMGNPDIILLDEPTNALDTNGVSLVRELILKQRERGALLVVSCHDRDFLDDVSDVIYHIQEGRIIDEA